MQKKIAMVAEMLKDRCILKGKIYRFVVYWAILAQSKIVDVSVNTKEFLKKENSFYIFSLLVVINYENKQT